MMEIFPDAASTWGDAYSHRLMCDNPGTSIRPLFGGQFCVLKDRERRLASAMDTMPDMCYEHLKKKEGFPRELTTLAKL